MTSQNLWSLYDRHFVSITWHNVWSWLLKIRHVIQIKCNHLVEENVHMIISLPTKRISVVRVTNISTSFTHKMATETSLHRYGTKLRHCHPVSRISLCSASCAS